MNTYKYTRIARQEAVDIAKRLLVDSIWKEANIELVGGITFPETNEILEGRVPDGSDVEKVIVVNNLKRAWKFLFEQLDYSLDYQTLCEYNNIIGSGGLYSSPGMIRQSLVRISGTNFIPQIPTFENITNLIKSWFSINNVVDQALTAFCQVARGQWFNNGNKRTAQLVANHILISQNVGIFSIADQDRFEFSKRLVEFYESDDIWAFKDWLYLKAVELFPSALTPGQMSEIGKTLPENDSPELNRLNTERKNVRIDENMVRTTYQYAKKVVAGEMRRIDAVHNISIDSGMSAGSASDYLNIYLRLKKGQGLKRMLKPKDLKMFLNWISQDDGKNSLDIAKESVAQSIEYWKTLPSGPNLDEINAILAELE